MLRTVLVLTLSPRAAGMRVMNPLIGLVFFFGVMVVVVGGAVMLGRWQGKRTSANLAALARDLGLQLRERPPALGIIPLAPTVSGRNGGRELRFFTFSTGSGKSRQTWNAMGLACANPQALTFQLGAQNFLTVIGVMLGMQDVQVGDPVFDGRFVVKTNAPDYLRAALLPELRAELLRCWPQRGMGANVKLAGSEIVYAELGSFADSGVVERMKTMLAPLAALAVLPEVYGGAR